MLYITDSRTTHTRLYDVSIAWADKNELYALPCRETSNYLLCIIDIDELEACALILKGNALFKCTLGESDSMYWRCSINTNDVEAVVDVCYDIFMGIT